MKQKENTYLADNYQNQIFCYKNVIKGIKVNKKISCEFLEFLNAFINKIDQQRWFL